TPTGGTRVVGNVGRRVTAGPVDRLPGEVGPRPGDEVGGDVERLLVGEGDRPVDRHVAPEECGRGPEPCHPRADVERARAPERRRERGACPSGPWHRAQTWPNTSRPRTVSPAMGVILPGPMPGSSPGGATPRE